MDVDEHIRTNEIIQDEYGVTSREYRQFGTLHCTSERVLFIADDSVAINMDYGDISGIEYKNPIPQYMKYAVGVPILLAGLASYVIFQLVYAYIALLIALIGLGLIISAGSTQFLQHAVTIHLPNRSFSFTADVEDADLEEAMRKIGENTYTYS